MEATGAGMANPASVFCGEQGGTLEIRTDADGGQYGVCVFADGSACDEWTFFRGECEANTPAAAVSGAVVPEVAVQPVDGWYGFVITPPAGQPFEYYLVLSPKESGNAGLIPANDEVATALMRLRDSGRAAHIWGTLSCSVAEVDGCQVEVARVRPEGPGEIFAADPVEAWDGTIESLPAGAQFDDVFVLDDPQFPVRYGIDAPDAEVARQIEALRDTGTVVSIFGELTCGVPDVNGCQIRVSYVEGGEDLPAADLPEDANVTGVNDWVGLIKSMPGGAQFDDTFERLSFDGGTYGIDAQDEALRQQIVALRDSGRQVHVWGRLVSNVPDAGGRQIVVTRLDVDERPEAPEIVTQPVEDWVGVVVSTPEMAQVDDYFQMMDQNGSRFGIWAEGALGEQLAALRDTGTVIHVWGLLRTNVPDAYNAQITVTRMEIGE